MKEFRKTEEGLFICEECGKTYKRLDDLGKHIKNKHVSQEYYYIKWLKEDDKEGLCKICNQPTSFIGFTCFYKNTCSKKCGNTYRKLQIEKSNLKNYGVYNSYQRQDVKEKCTEIHVKNLGVENPFQSQMIKEKIKNTNKIKYGVENPRQSKIIQEKAKQTCLIRYGNKNYNNHEKAEETCLKLYGVRIPCQNKEIHLKQQKHAYKLNKFKNTNILYRGSYELDFLENFYDKFPDIQNGPTIKYKFNRKERIYFPDFYIPSLNLIIECKNIWLYKKDKKIIKLKESSTIKAGYNYILILEKNYEKFNNNYSG